MQKKIVDFDVVLSQMVSGVSWIRGEATVILEIPGNGYVARDLFRYCQLL